MKISASDFLDRLQLDRETLEVWIEEEWLLPIGGTMDRGFSEGDLARGHLIRDLMDDLGVNAAGVGVALNLLDQVHGLRNVLADILDDARNAAT